MALEITPTERVRYIEKLNALIGSLTTVENIQSFINALTAGIVLEDNASGEELRELVLATRWAVLPNGIFTVDQALSAASMWKGVALKDRSQIVMNMLIVLADELIKKFAQGIEDDGGKHLHGLAFQSNSNVTRIKIVRGEVMSSSAIHMAKEDATSGGDDEVITQTEVYTPLNLISLVNIASLLMQGIQSQEHSPVVYSKLLVRGEPEV